MAKASVKFACTECGQSTARWLGQVPGLRLVRDARRGGASGPARLPVARPERARTPLRLDEVEIEAAARIPTGLTELDRVLGGGIVPASLVLVGGEPGVGKSTLLLMALASISRERRALLVTGEESAAQVKLRAERLGGAAGGGDPRGDLARDDLRDARARAARRLRDRLGADPLVERRRLRTRLGRPGARGGRPPAPRRQGERRRHAARRARDQGRLGRRAARARAPRRLRAPVRGRALPRAPGPACLQEPLRLDQRAGRLRDDRRRARRGAEPVRGLRSHGRRRGRAPRSPARSRGRGRSCSRCRRSSRRPTSRCPGASRPGSIPSAWR